VLVIILAPARAGRRSVIIAIETPIQNHRCDRADASLEKHPAREAPRLSRSKKFRIVRADSAGPCWGALAGLCARGSPRAWWLPLSHTLFRILNNELF